MWTLSNVNINFSTVDIITNQFIAGNAVLNLSIVNIGCSFILPFEDQTVPSVIAYVASAAS